MEKQLIRKHLLARRKQLNSAECHRLSLLVQQRLIDADCFSSAKTLALYSPVNNEVRTDLLFSAATAKQKRVCFPQVNGDVLQFRLVDSLAELNTGSFGVAEPRDGVALPLDEVDLLVVPGVAFDLDGFRLGYGKGFYDRELARCAAATVSAGLSFEFQLCEQLPVEAHDQRLDYVVTDARLIPCHSEVAGSL